MMVSQFQRFIDCFKMHAKANIGKEVTVLGVVSKYGIKLRNPYEYMNDVVKDLAAEGYTLRKMSRSGWVLTLPNGMPLTTDESKADADTDEDVVDANIDADADANVKVNADVNPDEGDKLSHKSYNYKTVEDITQDIDDLEGLKGIVVPKSGSKPQELNQKSNLKAPTLILKLTEKKMVFSDIVLMLSALGQIAEISGENVIVSLYIKNAVKD